MKKKWTLLLVLVVTLSLVGTLAGQDLVAQIKRPPDFQFEKGKGSPGAVTYSHESHTKKEPRCTTCHNNIFKMKRGSEILTMASMNQGKACGTCHNGNVAFSISRPADCAKCHRPS